MDFAPADEALRWVVSGIRYRIWHCVSDVVDEHMLWQVAD